MSQGWNLEVMLKFNEIMNARSKAVIAVAVVGLYLLGVSSSRANSVTVQEIGVNPNKVVSISVDSGIGGPYSVYAGVTRLLVNGVATPGFCIDPYQWSLPVPATYSVVDLTQAPNGHLMSSTQAETLGKLWSKYYSSAAADANVAAGLQIAIWMTVAGSDFTLNQANDYNAKAYLDSIGNYTGPSVDLVALTNDRGQDYLIANVPDGAATASLLGFALVGVGLLRRRFRA
jgi:hypothetical protein